MLGAMIAISILFWIGTMIAVPLVVVYLPVDYLTNEEHARLRNRVPSVWRYPYLIVKNIFGVLFIVAGLAMLVLPGQGILTLVLGLALINFPGKHRTIQRILGHRRVLAAINRLRARAKKPLMEKPPAAA
ncbi:MAG: PGPGW domain-containing protein [Desulfatitalea sp.]